MPGMESSFNDFLLSHISGDGTIEKAEKHLLDAPTSKRVRPKLILAYGKLLGVSDKELLQGAAAVELMHTGSLLHDDIIDKALERRSRPSVNALYGNTMALLAGDRLMSRAMLLFAEMDDSDVARQAAVVLIDLTAAMAFEDELPIADATKDDIMKIVDGKTGALFGLCGYLAGAAASDASASKSLMQAGCLLGRAFQLRDDIDDIEEDVANEVPTLPQLVGLKEVEDAIKQALRESVEQLKPYVGRPGYQELVEDMYTLARTPVTT